MMILMDKIARHLSKHGDICLHFSFHVQSLMWVDVTLNPQKDKRPVVGMM